MMFAGRTFAFTMGLLFAGSLWAADAAPKNRCAEFTKSVAKGTAKQKLKTFMDASWKYWMTEFPEWATYVGYPGQNDRWSDQSLAGVERHRQENLCQLNALKKIPRKDLQGEDRVTYDLAVHEFETSAQRSKFGDDFMPVNHLNGFQVDAVQLITAMPVATVADYENILKRFEGMPLMVQQNEELMREGLKRKLTEVKAFLAKINPQIDQLTTAKAEESPLYQPFKEFGPNIGAEEQKRLAARAREILTAKVYPALQKFKTFLNNEYIPQAREFIAFTEMPGGKEWYAFKVKRHTTTDKTPEELHQLGLNEVERITAQMNKIREQVKFDGDLKAFNKFLLKDKRFHYTNKEDLLAGYREIAKRADAELPKLFKRLPRLTYGVRAIADFAAPSSSGAQYIGGSLESGRPGWFEANTYDLPSRPKWDMETLTLHEAVPGHHFQIAIAQELEGLPEFRKHNGFTAFIEGWALYAESLGDDMGFFKDPYSKYGNLSGEMMRSIRLVVDTGMHAKGWSKQQALDYYRSKMPITDIDSEIEIDRYITWPGQALAYKVGQLKFRELRETAKTALGEKFDVREFHDEVLKHGALPLEVLEKTVAEWIAAEKIKNSKAKVRHASL